VCVWGAVFERCERSHFYSARASPPRRVGRSVQRDTYDRQTPPAQRSRDGQPPMLSILTPAMRGLIEPARYGREQPGTTVDGGKRTEAGETTRRGGGWGWGTRCRVTRKRSTVTERAMHSRGKGKPPRRSSWMPRARRGICLSSHRLLGSCTSAATFVSMRVRPGVRASAQRAAQGHPSY
jgi:hypothetical protein